MGGEILKIHRELSINGPHFTLTVSLVTIYINLSFEFTALLKWHGSTVNISLHNDSYPMNLFRTNNSVEIERVYLH
jgi:hypothetical protein